MPLVQGRKRRSQAIEEEDGVSSPEPATQRRRTASPASSGYGSDTQADNGSTSQDQMIKKLVRFALACEYQRKPIRRQDIGEKVLGSGGGGKQFQYVFAQAQLQLRSVFGMELMELPAREKVTLAQKRAAQKQNSQQSKSATSWILVSVLPPHFRSAAILSPSAIPTSKDEATYTAIATLFVSLIQLSGGTLAHAKLERFLRRVHMEDRTPVDGCEKTEKLLKRLEKEGYLWKVREATTMGEDVCWVVGPRGRVEVGGDGTRGLVREVYAVDQMAEAEVEELEGRLGKSLGLAGVDKRVEPRIEQGRKKRGRPRAGAPEELEEDRDDSEAEDDDEDE